MRTSVQCVERTHVFRTAHPPRMPSNAVSVSHGFLRSCAATAAALALLSTGCAQSATSAGNGTQAATSIERAKADRLAREQQIARTVPSLASIKLAQPRPLTLRDSGQSAALTFLRDIDLRIVGDIGFYVHRLSATLVPTQAGAPIVLDDPTSFEIDVHRGAVTLDDAKLTALFNGYIFGYRNAPLRKLHVSAGDGVIHLQGEMQRNGWVPFSLTGRLDIVDRTKLVFRPVSIRVSGINANPVMRAANVKMSDLLKIDTPIARLTGDDLVLDIGKLMPPPRLNITITALRITPGGVDLSLDDGSRAGFALPDSAPKQAMYIRGGDVKFMRSMPMNANLVIGPMRDASANEPFVLDLYHYRDQVSAGYFNFDNTGAITIRMPSYAKLNRPGSAPTFGAASARLNDSLLADQQTDLEAARRQWQAFALVDARGPAAQPGFRKIAVNRNAGAPARPTERRVSSRPTTIHLHNADFYIADNIGFRVDDLVVQLIAKRAGEPVDLDDPNQYDIRILSGSVLAPWQAMSDLFNRYLLDYSPRSLNDLKLSANGGNLRVQGGLKLWNQVPPGVWLPAEMEGTLTLVDERHLAFTPSQVSVLGVPQAKLLRALGIELSTLAPLKRRGAELRGDQLVLDQYTVFPPPVLAGRMSQATVEPDGLRLTFSPATDAPVLHPPASLPASYMWLESGDMKMFNVLELNARALIRNSTQARVRFDLYGYRDQVSQGSVQMAADGTLLVDLGKKNPLAP